MIKGTLVMSIGNVIVKALNSVYKITLLSVITVSGIGYFNSAGVIYGAAFTLATSGLSVTVSRLTAAARSAGRTGEGRRVMRLAFVMYFASSIAALCVIVFCGRRIV